LRWYLEEYMAQRVSVRRRGRTNRVRSLCRYGCSTSSAGRRIRASSIRA
jgi:hypothetical protein